MPSGLTPRSTVFALGAVLDGRSPGDACVPSELVDRAIRHRVSALLARTEYARQLPSADRARLDEHVRLSTLHATLLDEDLRELLPRLAARGVAPLVVKGAQLAHTVYAAPYQRPRADTDLLIDARDREAIAGALGSLGYKRSTTTSGSVIFGEFQWERALRGGVVHYVDVHWRVAAPLMFERAFDVGEIAAASCPIPALGPGAIGPATHDALALASVHLVAHHWEQLLLLWLHDVRLLADALDVQGRQRVIDSAIKGEYTVAVYCALRTTRLYFRSAALDRLIDELEVRLNSREPVAALLRYDRRAVDDLIFDLRVADWRQRARLLREHVLPPPEYMRAAFAGRPLALAYAERLLRGVWKWF